MPSRAAIPGNATIADLKGSAARREEYVRKVVENFYELGSKHPEFVVRIGVQGKGLAPHYKLEAAVPVTYNGQTVGEEQETFEIYNGRNHKRMTAFEIEAVRPEHWSNKTMTFSEVLEHFKTLRTKPMKA